jgi:hypothetical protein
MVVANVIQFGKGRDGFATKKQMDEEEEEDTFKTGVVDEEDEEPFKNEEDEDEEAFENEMEEEDTFKVAGPKPRTERSISSRSGTQGFTAPSVQGKVDMHSQPATNSRPAISSRPAINSRPAMNRPTSSGRAMPMIKRA